MRRIRRALKKVKRSTVAAFAATAALYRQHVLGSTAPPLSGVLVDERTGLGDDRPYQPNRCYLFDGTNDHIEFSSHPLSGNTGDWTMCGWVYLTANGSFPMVYSTSTERVELRFLANSRQLNSQSYSGVTWNIATALVTPLNTWAHIAVSYVASTKTVTLYQDGVSVASAVGSGTDIDFGSDLEIGSRNNAYPFPGKMSDLRILDVAVSDFTDIMAGTTDGNEIWRLKMQEGSGSTSFDSSGNGSDGTITNATLSTFHSTDANLPYNFLNEEGYTLSGSVYVPLDDSDPTNDVQGNPLGFSGIAPNPAQAIGSPCGTFDGVDDYLSLPHLSGSETVSSSGGTSTPTVSAGRIDFTAGTCWDLQLSDGSRYPISEYSGATVYDVSGNGNDGTINNATTTAGAGFWANTQDVFHWSLAKGFRADSGAEIPALADGSAAADGNAITNPAIVGHNGGVTELTLADGDWAFNDSRSNPAFKRNTTESSVVVSVDRFLTARETLSGDDLTAAQDYTATTGD